MIQLDWRSEKNAPEPGSHVCSLDEIESGKVREIKLGSENPFRMLLYRNGDTVSAYVNLCPHHWLPMNKEGGDFLMWSDDELMCSHHSAVFKLSMDGIAVMGPCQGSNLIQIPLQVMQGEVRVAVGDDLS